jgi:guanosine-3',5'-bis(diphosphate) 3'-pyrophosphohydrolase
MRGSPQAENFKKVLSTLVEDVRVVLIKMADRFHNMRTIGAMPPHKQLKVAAETSYIYAPLAHRLGLYAIKNEFEDLCLKVTNPDIYFEIARKLKDTRKGRNAYIETFIKPLKKSLDEVGLPYRIYGRPKSIFSIWNKIKSKQVPFEQIYDLFAIRIVIDVDKHLEKRNCWVVYSIVTDHFHPIPARLKDWVTTPKVQRLRIIAYYGSWARKGATWKSRSVQSVWKISPREVLPPTGNTKATSDGPMFMRFGWIASARL